MEIDLITEGLRNEIRHFIQNIRKDLDFGVNEKIFCLVSLGDISTKYIDITSPYRYVYERDWLFNEEIKESCMEHIQDRCLLSTFIIERNTMLFDGINPVHNMELNNVLRYCKRNLNPIKVSFINYPGDNPINLKIYIKKHD